MLIILPAYNEEQSIGRVIEDIRKNIPTADILVVNDGSKDNTSKIAKQLNVLVIDLPFNLGIGSAVQTGFKFALKENYDICVQCDADGQHPAYQIKNLISPLLENSIDIVAGSRFLRKYSYKSTIPRQIGIFLFSKLLSFITKISLTDTTCGFRAFDRKAIEFFAEFYPCDYPEVEALILAYKRGLKIKEVPIRIIERKEGISSIGFWSAFYYTIKVFLAVIIDLFENLPKKKLC
ncbi:MAG: glycosyltransferase family 2 protein [Candidatus Omnitrophica bacterium]|nr:glycosyltransferase family 2 protein [Candidatus Omnitrophota bacterium]